MKNFLKRSLSLLLTVLMIYSLVPAMTFTAGAAGTLTTSYEKLGASWTDASNSNGKASWSAGGTTITGTATGYTQYWVSKKSITTTLTLTNNMSEEATLKFDYTLSNGGSVSGAISGTSGSYNNVLAGGASITITLTSPSGSSTNTLSITGISLISTSAGNVTTNFISASGGSYTVNGESVSTNVIKTEAAGTEYKLVATPASGYVFRGWSDGSSYLSKNSTYTYTASFDNVTITPVFISSTVAQFGVGAETFYDLTEACNYALTASTKTVVLLNNGTVSGSHTIPAGVKLLVPYNSSNTAHGANASSTSYTDLLGGKGHIPWVSPTKYRELTLAANAKITVNGSIEVGGQHAAAGGALGCYGGSPTGPLGYIKMLSGSEITLNKDANLYCWGYIYGGGEITAEEGSHVYENFQIMDFRGGEVTTALGVSQKFVFPISQYYVQNIEVKTKYMYGSVEHVVTSVYISRMNQTGAVDFIGSNAMFRPQDGSYLIKYYDGKNDRLVLETYGSCSFASMSLTLASNTVDSSVFALPLTNNIDIVVKTGEVMLNQDLMMLPGSTLTIENGATLNLTKNSSNANKSVTAGGHVLYIFDSENWTSGHYLGSYDNNTGKLTNPTYVEESGLLFVHPKKKLSPVAYSPTKEKTRTESDIKDVVVDVNGTIKTSGYLYTTVKFKDAVNGDYSIVGGGAEIISSGGTGVISMLNGAGTEKYAVLYNQGDEKYYGIPLASAQLKNGDETYTNTTGAVAGDVFNYCEKCDKWVKQVKVTFNSNYEVEGVTDKVYVQEIECGTCGVNLDGIDEIGFAHPNGTEFCHWESGSGEFKDGQSIKFSEDEITLNASWGHKDVNPPDHNCDSCGEHISEHTGGEADCKSPAECVVCGEKYGEKSDVHKYPDNFEYIYIDDENHKKVYSYCGTEVGIEGHVYDEDHKCVCDDVEKFTITFDTNGGSDVGNITASFGSPVTKPVPAREGYDFLGWDINGDGKYEAENDVFPTSVPGENITVTAIWQVLEFTVTFMNDGTVYYSDTVKYGDEIPVPADPEKTGYKFTGWSPVVEGTMPAKDLEFIAGWQIEQYTITFYTDGGTEIAPITQNFGSAVTAPQAPTKEGYTFKGWDKTVPATMPAGDVTITATWEINQYTIIFKDTDGKELYSITQNYGTDVTDPADPTKEGYTFASWDKEVPTTMPAEDTIITAVWEANKYTITFDPDGGSDVESITAGYETDITKPADPTKEGHSFLGWDINGDDSYDNVNDVFPATMPLGGASYKAIWQINQYSITYDENINGADNEKAVISGYFGDNVTPFPEPQRPGYTFLGWDIDLYKELDEQADEMPTTVPAKNFNARAVWTINTYTVTFIGNGGTASGDVEKVTEPYDHGTYVSFAENKFDCGFSRVGYTFIGWKIGDTVYDENDIENDIFKVTDDITLTAQWKINEYTVTFKNGYGGIISSEKVVYNSPIEYPQDPEREGYSFTGWDNDITNVPANDVTINATWNINQYTITIIFGNGTDDKVIAGDYGSVIDNNIADPTREGYTFTGWSEPIPATMPAGDMNITANWKINQYTITFNTDGGSAIAAITQDFGTEVSKPADPTKTGYTFAGWDAEIPDTIPAKNITIKAKWTINQYTITFNTDGGSAIAAITQDYGTEVTKPADPTKTGYTFAGWDVPVPSAMPAENVTVTAQWKINQYTITFDTDGGSTIAAITQDFGTGVTKPADPTKTGYTFDGWDADIPATMPAGDMTITANWKINQYTITFNTDGGSAIAAITQDFGTEVIEPAEPTKTGYTFVGWDVPVPSTMPAENVTITAKWKINQYTITFNTDGGSEIKAISQDYGTGIIVPANPTKTGYTFDCWDIEIPATMPAGNITITAIWTINQYTVTFKNGYDGIVIKSDKLDYNSLIAYPENPEREGYSFTGWDNDITNVPANDVTINAAWNINQYTVTIIYGNGTDNKVITQDYGTAIDAIENPTMTGYTFDGWDAEIPATMPAGDMTIKAKWTINQYTITFDTKGGSAIDDITADYNSGYTKPGDPEKEGHTFKGWDENGDDTADVLPEAMPLGGKSYTAIWEVNSYTVTFTINGELYDGPGAVVEVKYGDSIPVPDYIVDDNQNFYGWVVPDTMPAGNQTYDAKLTNDYFVTWWVHGKDGAVVPVVVTYEQDADLSNVPTGSVFCENYSIVGWAASQGGEIVTLPEKVTGNVQYYAVYEHKTDDVVYKYKDVGNKTHTKYFDCCGTVIDENADHVYDNVAHKCECGDIENFTITYYVDDKFYAEETNDFGDTITALTYTKVGHTFSGWDMVLPATMPAENIVLNGTTTVDQYTITFDTDGGSYVSPITQDFGTEITKPADPTKTGYTFAGWDTEIPATMPAENMTVKAQWKINQYTVTIVYNNGNADKVITKNFGETIETVTDPVKTGYTFKGWDAEIPTAMPAEDMIITAQWEAIQYTISFNTVGGSAVDSITGIYESTVTGPADPVKEGYTFVGWTPAVPAIMPAQNVTLTAIWTINQYTVTFDVDGDKTLIVPITGDYNTVINAPAAPTKEGYTFAGWSPVLPETIPAENMTVAATWTINKYTITFDTAGGSEIAAITQDYGTAIDAIENPTKPGYTFNGWDTEIPDTMPAEDMTIKAKWTINQYTITFDTDGGTAIDSITQDFDTEVTEPTDPTKTGYTFAGWDTEIPDKMPAEDMVIKAKWTINQYTITFDTDGGTAIDSITQDFDTEVTEPTDPTKTGYTFAGWDAEIPDTMPAEDMTIKAKWTINQYTITFNTDGGTAIDSITQDFGTEVTEPAVPTKIGYTFAGWDADIPATMPAGDMTIKASWKINQYTITFNTDGGSEIADIKQDYGTAVKVPAAPTKTGYTFAGWDKNIPGKMPAGDITITALWTINKYTVTFDTNGGSVIGNVYADYGTAIVPPADPTKTGYTFAGWDKEIPSTIPAENVTITAQWTINQYTITFDTDGGTAIESITQDYNTAVTAPADPTKTGYTFAGWTPAVPSAMPADDITVKAQWTINQYTITFDTDGGNAIAAIKQDYNTAVIAPADPTKTGYTFAGWDTNIPANMPAENMTIKAKWTVNQYTITFDTAGGTVIAPITQNYGTAVTAPADPIREGYTFTGWDKSVPATMAAEDITITATWKVNRYTISYNTDGGSRVNSFTGDYGTAVTKPADPTKTGYTFDGWDVAVPDTVPAGNITITAKWKVNSYKVTFLNGYDAVISEIDCEFGSEIVYPQNPEREGYTFIGWDSNEINVPARDITITAKWSINKYTISFADTGDKNIQSITQDYGTAVIAPANPTKYGHTFAGWDTEIPATMPGEDITITALWTVNQYTIRFNTDGGNAIADIVADYGSEVIAPADPTRDGYTFIGWNKIIPTTMPAEDVVITARWQINRYTVTFDVNGGTLDEEQPSFVSGNYGTPVTRPTDPAKMGYTFIGWDVNDDGVIDEDDIFPETIPGRDLTLKALWAINSYTVTFEDGYSDTPIKVDTVEYESVIVYPAAPKRVGHTFVGWDSDISNVPSKNVTITALWEVNEYTISYYDALSGEAILVKTEKVPYDEAIPDFPYVHAGYTLLYWTLKDSTDPYIFPETMPAENIDLYAVLELNYYNVTFINLGEKLAEKNGFIYGDSVYEVMGEIGVESRIGYTFMGWFDGDGRKYTEGYTVPDNEVVFTAKWEANKHEVNIVFTKDNCEEYADIQLIPYDTPILSKLPVLTGYTGIDGIYHEFIGWDYFDDHGGTEVPETMPDCNINIYAVYAITGWVSAEVNGVSGMQYIVRDEVQKTGWTEIDGNWYYLDPVTGLRAVGLTRVSYPDEPINGVTYAPDPDDLASAEKYGYTDAETARFIFDENGVFRGDINGLYGDNWAVNGHLPWHVGLVQIGEDYYYYFRGNTTAKSENVYVVRNTTKLDVTVGGVYTFDENGKLAKYDGITDIGNTRYYYEDYRLMLGKGLIKVEDDYYYVRSSGALVVSTTGYWVSKTNNFDVAAGYYDFDAEGKLISTVKEKQNGIYSEIDGIFYYEDGVRTAKGLIRVSGTNSSYDGEIIYVRANGQLVVGKYWVTNTGGLMERGFYYFDENGILVEEKNGIIDGYYYVDGKIAYGAGLILIDGDYYYVRSNGRVAVGDYWITNVNDTGVIVGKYNFADDGKMTTDPLFTAEDATTGVYDGFYYENGKIAYAKGLVEYDGGYIYVRSSGRIATGKYWATNHNGLLPAGLYDFGEDGILSF